MSGTVISKALNPPRVNPWKVVQKLRQGKPLSPTEKFLVEISGISGTEPRLEIMRRIVLSFRALRDIARLFHIHGREQKRRNILRGEVTYLTLPKADTMKLLIELADREYDGAHGLVLEAFDFMKKLTVVKENDGQYIALDGNIVTIEDTVPKLPRERQELEKFLQVLVEYYNKNECPIVKRVKWLDVGLIMMNNVLNKLGYDVATPREAVEILEKCRKIGLVQHFEVYRNRNGTGTTRPRQIKTLRFKIFLA